MQFKIYCLLVIVIFYSIYFTKMFVQKHHGIQTHQIGRRKEVEIHTTETFMSFATLGIVIAQLISIIFDWSYLPVGIRFIGFCIGMLGDLIFLLSVLCMKDSWRAGIPDKDKTKLVTTGIYQYSRNPAFLGFDLMYLGIMCMYCNGLTIFFTIFAIIMLHLQILQEEKYLVSTFGLEYQMYQKQVFRYLGKKYIVKKN